MPLMKSSMLPHKVTDVSWGTKRPASHEHCNSKRAGGRQLLARWESAVSTWPGWMRWLTHSQQPLLGFHPTGCDCSLQNCAILWPSR